MGLLRFVPATIIALCLWALIYLAIRGARS